MSYRIPEQRKHVYDISSRSLVCVENGSISRLTINCFYSIKVLSSRLHRAIHDHLGWPSPSRPDRSCQLPPENDANVISREIDLPGEGYDSIEVSFVDPPEGLSMSGTIEYNVISVTIEAMCESATTEDIEVEFAIYATGTSYPDGDPIELRDVVTKGTLRILAGPID